MQIQKTHYQVLGVSPSASAEEIKAAYELLVARCAAKAGDPAQGKPGELYLIENAYWALSDAQRRALYDASGAIQGIPLQLSVEVKEKKSPLQKTVLIMVGILLAMGIVMQVAFMVVGGRRQASVASELQRERVILHEQQQEMGVFSAQDRAAEERRRREYEQKSEEERQKREEEKQARELEENRRYADRVSRELYAAEERARREAEYERQRREQEEAQKKRQEEARLERVRRGLN